MKPKDLFCPVLFPSLEAHLELLGAMSPKSKLKTSQGRNDYQYSPAGTWLPDHHEHTCSRRLTFVLSSGSSARTFPLPNPVTNTTVGLMLSCHSPIPLLSKERKTTATTTKKQNISSIVQLKQEPRSFFNLGEEREEPMQNKSHFPYYSQGQARQSL